MQIYVNLALGLLTCSIVPYIMNKFYEWKKERELCNKINLERVYDWGKVDAIIEDELKDSSFEQTYEIDQIILEYSAIFKNIGLLFMFGMLIPGAWFIACISTYIGRKAFFNRLILFTKRPLPRGAQDIGSWEKILQIINVISIFFTAALNGYNTRVLEWASFPTDRHDKEVFAFYVFAFAGMAIRMLAYLLVSEVSGTFSQIFRRQKNRTAIVKKDNFLAQTQRCGMHMVVPDQMNEMLAKNKQALKAKRAKQEQDALTTTSKDKVIPEIKKLETIKEEKSEDVQNENL